MIVSADGYEALPAGAAAEAEGAASPEMAAALRRQDTALEQWRRHEKPAESGVPEGGKLHASAQSGSEKNLKTLLKKDLLKKVRFRCHVLLHSSRCGV